MTFYKVTAAAVILTLYRHRELERMEGKQNDRYVH